MLCVHLPEGFDVLGSKCHVIKKYHSEKFYNTVTKCLIYCTSLLHDTVYRQSLKIRVLLALT
jgi:hypothetical protein